MSNCQQGVDLDRFHHDFRNPARKGGVDLEHFHAAFTRFESALPAEVASEIKELERR